MSRITTLTSVDTEAAISPAAHSLKRASYRILKLLNEIDGMVGYQQRSLVQDRVSKYACRPFEKVRESMAYKKRTEMAESSALERKGHGESQTALEPATPVNRYGAKCPPLLGF